jgi:hypothetical protein
MIVLFGTFSVLLEVFKGMAEGTVVAPLLVV